MGHATEAERALTMAGFQHAFVYRWQGGLLDGHVLLDTLQGAERRVSLNTDEMAQDAHEHLLFEAGERDGKSQLDPAQVSGLIMIAIRPKTTGTAGHECIVSISITIDREGKSAGAGTGPIFGRLPDFVSFVGDAQHGNLTLADGGKRDLFELRLSRNLLPAKESRTEAKGALAAASPGRMIPELRYS